MERRELFRIIGAGAVAAELSLAQHNHGSQESKPYSPQFFSKEQIELLDQLCEIIIPADEQSPGAREAKVWEYIDIMAFYGGKSIQEPLVVGFKHVESEAERRFGKAFLRLDATEQDSIVAAMADKEKNREDVSGRFFGFLKSMTIAGYHYSEVGQEKFMGYKGNTAVRDFDGCNHPEHEVS
ncbi:MAG: gluconate 2-dehydrogenase subunit 3 family protein [Bryobacteraceae bacterium]